MRVVVYGRDSTIQKLITILDDEGIEVAGVSDGLHEIMGWKTDNDFDFAIVDSQARDTGETCKRIRKYWNIPVVMMINQKKANWKELSNLEVDGYLPETAEGIELSARLRAVIRKYSLPGGFEKITS